VAFCFALPALLDEAGGGDVLLLDRQPSNRSLSLTFAHKGEPSAAYRVCVRNQIRRILLSLTDRTNITDADRPFSCREDLVVSAFLPQLESNSAGLRWRDWKVLAFVLAASMMANLPRSGWPLLLSSATAAVGETRAFDAVPIRISERESDFQPSGSVELADGKAIVADVQQGLVSQLLVLAERCRQTAITES
jgi:hypothetical protein